MVQPGDHMYHTGHGHHHAYGEEANVINDHLFVTHRVKL
jgi:hypothetical protein